MKKIYIIAIVLAIVTGITSFIFFLTIMNNSTEDYVNVVVGAKQIEMGTVLTNDMLVIKRIPAKGAHPDAAHSISEVSGCFTVGPIEKDEQILVSNLSKSATNTGILSYSIPVGMRAISIQVDNVSSISNLISPGNRVDIIATLDLVGSDGKTKVSTTFILLQNVEVLAVGNITNGNLPANTQYQTMTFAIAPNDVLKLINADVNGKVELALRYPRDDQDANTTPQTPDSFSSGVSK